MGVIMDEPTIVAAHSKELLNVLDTSRLRQFNNRLDTAWVHFYPTLTSNVHKKLDFYISKGTFRFPKKNLVSTKAFKDSPKML